MSTDWKALAAELAAELERCRPLAEVPDCLARARAALTAEADGPAVPESREPASVVGEPSDEELLELGQFHCVSYTLSDGTVVSPYVEDTDMRSEVLSFARAVLSRYGHHPAPAAEGDVGELVAKLRRLAPQNPLGTADPTITRAAVLLSQRHPTPVPVSERLPGPEDCDAEGRCWWWYPPVPEQNYGYWSYEDNAVPERSRLEWPDSWLPTTALPLPQGEVQ